MKVPARRVTIKRSNDQMSDFDPYFFILYIQGSSSELNYKCLTTGQNSRSFWACFNVPKSVNLQLLRWSKRMLAQWPYYFVPNCRGVGQIINFGKKTLSSIKRMT